MISENELETALLYLAQSSEDYANARAQAGYTADLVGHTEGVLMREVYADQPVTIRKQVARADEKYVEALQAKRDAEQRYAVLYAKRQRAALTIDVYRTQSANQRQPTI